jgi:hypothetical protein
MNKIGKIVSCSLPQSLRDLFQKYLDTHEGETKASVLKTAITQLFEEEECKKPPLS